MDKEEVNKAIKRDQIKDNLEQDFIATINDRVTRYLELDFIKITPKTTMDIVELDIELEKN